MTFKELMYEWIRSETKHLIFSVEEMLSLSDFADWLDSREADKTQPHEHIEADFDYICAYCNELVRHVLAP